MRRRLLALPLLAAVLAGCTDVSPLAPRGPARNTVPTYQFSISGNTVGPGGQIWQVTSGPTVCGSNSWTYWVYYGTSTIWVNSGTSLHCRSSALATWDAQTYNGGQVSVIGSYEGQTEHLTTITGDMSTEAFTSDLAQGTLVTLEAYPDPGCEFTRFAFSGGNEAENPKTIDPSQVSNVRAWFYCGGS